ncbi:MAG: hypothetical protein ACUVR8_13305 [Acidobacteriota bacterium]
MQLPLFELERKKPLRHRLLPAQTWMEQPSHCRRFASGDEPAAEREGHKVQMIYIDLSYGIRYDATV